MKGYFVWSEDEKLRSILENELHYSIHPNGVLINSVEEALDLSIKMVEVDIPDPPTIPSNEHRKKNLPKYRLKDGFVGDMHDIAEYLNISSGRVSRILRGKDKPPTRFFRLFPASEVCQSN